MEGAYIGPQLKAARKLKGIRNTKDLAGRIGRSGFGEKVIGQIERDERQARDYELPWLADALEMTVDDLLRKPKPMAGEDVVIDRLEAILRMLADATREREQHASEIRGLLKRIEDTLKAEEAAKAETDRARRDLLAAVAVANRALRAGAPPPVEAPESPAR